MVKLQKKHKNLLALLVVGGAISLFIVVNFVEESKFGNIAFMMFVINVVFITVIYPRLK